MKDLGVTEKNYSTMTLKKVAEDKVIKGNENFRAYTETVEE